ncbi:MAG: XRE family transcriptional regulator [Actinomycetota bacterium]
MDEPVFAAERLELARLRRGYNKTRLAALVGVTAPTITSYERARRDPPPSMVARLAEALEFPESFFYAAMGDLVPLEAASFRALSRMSASQRDAALASGTLCTEFEAWLSDRFELPTPNLPDVDQRVVDPAGAAAQVRASWGLGSAPVSNVLQTLEANGVRVFALAAECQEVDAFSFWQDSTNTPYIIVGTHKTPERQVFDLAHELAHLVLHRHHGEPRGKTEEREADLFASSFLMPRDDLLVAAPRAPTFNDLVTAKHRWKVSVAALGFRLRQLELMTDWSYHRLCVQLSRIGRAEEPNSLPREQSQVLAKTLAALRKEGITRARIASELNLRRSDLDALIGRLVVTSVDGGREATPPSHPPLRLVE